jgi:hypothetical protein
MRCAPVSALACLTCALLASPAVAGGWGAFCSATARVQLGACRNEVRDDFLTAWAVCINVSDAEEREECFEDAGEERSEQQQLCYEQLEARRDLCEELGEERYDPDFDPAAFDPDPRNPTNPNDYFPLAVDDEWDYEGGDEEIHVRVLDETKLIEGVTCIVVRDTVEEDGELKEDTNDWFGLALNGDVHYCGEQTATFETFPGDDPEKPELVDIEGAWKAGRDGAKPGIQFLATPHEDDVYRQEWSPGNAEDAARVISTTYDYADGGELNEHVPQGLAELLCDHDCVVTEEFTAIEPDALELKYFARRIGLFLEVSPESGEVVQLVGCSLAGDVLDKCSGL